MIEKLIKWIQDGVLKLFAKNKEKERGVSENERPKKPTDDIYPLF